MCDLCASYSLCVDVYVRACGDFRCKVAFFPPTYNDLSVVFLCVILLCKCELFCGVSEFTCLCECVCFHACVSRLFACLRVCMCVRPRERSLNV